jgi:hypothetical protein
MMGGWRFRGAGGRPKVAGGCPRRKSPVLLIFAFDDRNGRLADSRMELTPSPAEMVGNSAARVKPTMARALRKRAWATFRS